MANSSPWYPVIINFLVVSPDRSHVAVPSPIMIEYHRYEPEYQAYYINVYYRDNIRWNDYDLYIHQRIDAQTINTVIIPWDNIDSVKRI